MSYVNLRTILYSLGYKRVKTIWGSLEVDMEKGSCEIRNDRELMTLILQKEEGGRVDFYVEYCGPNFNPLDDSIDLSNIDMESFPKSEEWLEVVNDSQKPGPNPVPSPALSPAPIPASGQANFSNQIPGLPSASFLALADSEGFQIVAIDVQTAVEKGRGERYRESNVDDDEEYIADEAEINEADEHFSSEDLSSDFRESDDDDDDLFWKNVDFIEDTATDQQWSQHFNGFSEVVGDIGPDPGIESDHLDSPINSENEDRVSRPRVREFNPETNYNKELSLQVGDLFRDYKEFKKFLKEYCIQQGFDFMFSKNEKHRIVAKCKGATCKCSVRASDCTKSGEFKVKTMTSEHNCAREYNNQRVTYHWLADKYNEHIRDDPSWLVSAFQKNVLRNVKVKANRQKCYRTRLKCIKELYGKDVEQFSNVRDYATALIKASPRSTTIVDIDDDKFRRFYVCLEACKRGFVETCRPLIAIDGCHLKGPFGGQLLVAVGKDANDSMYPIAWATVETENKESWKWFLDRLLDDIGSVEQHG